MKGKKIFMGILYIPFRVGKYWKWGICKLENVQNFYQDSLPKMSYQNL